MVYFCAYDIFYRSCVKQQTPPTKSAGFVAFKNVVIAYLSFERRRNAGTGHRFVIHYVHNNLRPRLIRLAIINRQDIIPARGALASDIKTKVIEFQLL